MPPKSRAIRGRGLKGRGRGRGVPSVSVIDSEVEKIDRPIIQESQQTINQTLTRQREDSGDETDVSSVAGGSKMEKKQKVVVDLTVEEEQNMVEWLQANPIFYNKKMLSYKETAKKERMWIEKAMELGKTVMILKTWYASMRTRYGKLKKTKSGDADKEVTERDDWIIRNFEFLHSHIHEVQKKTTVSMKQKIAASCTSSATPMDELNDNLGELPKSTKITTSSRSKQGTHISEAEDAVLAGIEDRGQKMMALQQKMLDQLRPASTDRERDAFVNWIRTVVNELEHSLWRRCQQEISNTLYRYINDNDQLKRNPASGHSIPQIQSHSMTPLQSSTPACSARWQPPPSQWPTNPTSNVSVWQSQDANWMAQQIMFPEPIQHTLTHLQPLRTVSTGSSVASYDSVSVVSTPPTTSQGDNSRGSQSSFHLSDLINMPETGLDDTQ